MNAIEGFTARLCRRIAEVRRTHFGARGKAEFSRTLGIRPSTYDRYERDRTPPADLLVRVAERTGTSLRWLLTGEGPRYVAASADDQPHQELLDRVQHVLRERPTVASQIAAFLDAIEGADPHSAGDHTTTHERADLIPIVGSTAAGLAHYWRDLPTTSGGPEVDKRLESVLRTAEEPHPVPAVLTDSTQIQRRQTAAIVQFSQPELHGFLEFLDAGSLREQYPRAVAWRIDGDSMHPRFADGDIVVTSSNIPAAAGHPCVARQRGQIGVNCKLYQETVDTILLVPINERYPVQHVERSDLEWTARVLYSVRLNR